MAVIRIDWQGTSPEPCRGGIVTIGNFDGVHRGHAHLLARARTHADPRQAPVVAVTFEPHPLQLLRPELYQPTLTTMDDRADLLHQAGADHVLILRTEPSLLELSAADFFAQVVRGHLHAAGLVEGPGFGFGRNREGDVQTLARLCADAGLLLEIVPPFQIEGVPVSSSRVRTALVAGDVAAAERGLGRPYRLHGLVGVGQRRGQGLGFPTANLTEVKTIIPGDGVYAVRAWPTLSPSHAPTLLRCYPAAANVGPNPTFGEQARKIEVHLLGFQGDLYGQPLAIDFLARLRDARKFASVDELLKQIQTDVARVHELVR